MATISPVHWKALTSPLQKAFTFVEQQPFAERFYLAGGAGLAMQLGHRRSLTLDYYSLSDRILLDTRQEIIHDFESLEPQIIDNADGRLLLNVGSAPIGFFYYDRRLLEPTGEIDYMSVASVVDTALMRLEAMMTTGSRNDFYDVFAVSQKIPLYDLLDMAKEKYPEVPDFSKRAVEGLVKFEKADRDRQPYLFINYPWSRVRQFFVDVNKTLSE
jgi:hypothetical protein